MIPVVDNIRVFAIYGEGSHCKYYALSRLALSQMDICGQNLYSSLQKGARKDPGKLKVRQNKTNLFFNGIQTPYDAILPAANMYIQSGRQLDEKDRLDLADN